MVEKWEHAHAMGFEGIELSGPASAVEARFPELIEARREGAVFPTVSSGGQPFIGDRDADRRRDAVTNMKRLLTAIAELGGAGAATPACFGRYSNAIPALKPPMDGGERQTLIETVAGLGQHAEREGVVLLLEPLNRYEDHHLNRLEQALDVVAATGSPAVKLLADVFHMNIEEADPAAAARRAGGHIQHVQLADSNRLEPGAGHLDFVAIFRALMDIRYSRYCALECSLSADPHTILPRVVKHLHAVWRTAQGAAA
jgi:sugar phosphate isomerase/epimerase